MCIFDERDWMRGMSYAHMHRGHPDVSGLSELCKSRPATRAYKILSALGIMKTPQEQCETLAKKIEAAAVETRDIIQYHEDSLKAITHGMERYTTEIQSCSQAVRAYNFMEEKKANPSAECPPEITELCQKLIQAEAKLPPIEQRPAKWRREQANMLMRAYRDDRQYVYLQQLHSDHKRHMEEFQNYMKVLCENAGLAREKAGQNPRREDVSVLALQVQKNLEEFEKNRIAALSIQSAKEGLERETFESLASRLERKKKDPNAQTVLEMRAEGIISRDQNNKDEFYPAVDAPDRVYNAVSNARKRYLDAMDKAEKCIAPIHQNMLQQAFYRITDRIGITSPTKRIGKIQDRYFNTSAELNNAVKGIDSEIDVLYDERKNLRALLPKNPDITKEDERKDLIDKHKVWETTKAAMDSWIQELSHKRDQVYGRKELIELKLSEFGTYCKNASV